MPDTETCLGGRLLWASVTLGVPVGLSGRRGVILEGVPYSMSELHRLRASINERSTRKPPRRAGGAGVEATTSRLLRLKNPVGPQPG